MKRANSLERNLQVPLTTSLRISSRTVALPPLFTYQYLSNDTESNGGTTRQCSRISVASSTLKNFGLPLRHQLMAFLLGRLRKPITSNYGNIKKDGIKLSYDRTLNRKRQPLPSSF